MSANLTPTPGDVAIVTCIEKFTARAEEAIAIGAIVRYNTTTGLLTNANGTSAAEARACGMAVSKDGTGVYTVLRKGIVDVGDVLGDLTYDDDVYLSDTDGLLADDTAPTVDVIVGTVVPKSNYPSAADKLLRIDL